MEPRECNESTCPSRKWEGYTDTDIEKFDQQYSANLIAENLYDHADDAILDHKKTKDAIPKSNGHVISKNGQTKNKITSKRLEHLVQWKDNLTSCVPLIDIYIGIISSTTGRVR